MSLLHDILENKRVEIEALRAKPLPSPRRRPRSVALRDPNALSLIAEIKRKSPSAGVLSMGLTVEERATAYADGGAKMISVLCDEKFFDGGFEHVARARAALDAKAHAVPILAKEFVLDPLQIEWAAASGASAVLVIVRIVDDATLARLLETANGHDVSALVEVASHEELARALAVGAKLVGVNARDLDTLAIDRCRAEEVTAKIPEGVVAVHLSGIRNADDVAATARSRADAALIGESLMREDDPGLVLRGMVAAARRSS